MLAKHSQESKPVTAAQAPPAGREGGAMLHIRTAQIVPVPLALATAPPAGCVDALGDRR